MCIQYLFSKASSTQLLDRKNYRRIKDVSYLQSIMTAIFVFTYHICVVRHPRQKSRDVINTVALPLWLMGISIGLIFDNNQMAACLSDVQPR